MEAFKDVARRALLRETSEERMRGLARYVHCHGGTVKCENKIELLIITRGKSV